MAPWIRHDDVGYFCNQAADDARAVTSACREAYAPGREAVCVGALVGCDHEIDPTHPSGFRYADRI
jgi:hypothetical protein